MTDIGAHRPDPYRGWLVFNALPTELALAEDSTLASDNRLLMHYDPRGQCFDRPATETERTLLAHLGFTLPDDLVTHVDRISTSVRQRRWPALESQITEDGGFPAP
jgi:hypothetical protein